MLKKMRFKSSPSKKNIKVSSFCFSLHVFLPWFVAATAVVVIVSCSYLRPPLHSSIHGRHQVIIIFKFNFVFLLDMRI